MIIPAENLLGIVFHQRRMLLRKIDVVQVINIGKGIAAQRKLRLRKRDFSQIGIRKRLCADVGHSAGDIDLIQINRPIKCAVANRLKAFGQHNPLGFSSVEGILPDMLDVLGQHNFFRAASFKSALSDCRDAASSQFIRDRERNARFAVYVSGIPYDFRRAVIEWDESVFLRAPHVNLFSQAGHIFKLCVQHAGVRQIHSGLFIIRRQAVFSFLIDALQPLKRTEVIRINLQGLLKPLCGHCIILLNAFAIAVHEANIVRSSGAAVLHTEQVPFHGLLIILLNALASIIKIAYIRALDAIQTIVAGFICLQIPLHRRGIIALLLINASDIVHRESIPQRSCLHMPFQRLLDILLDAFSILVHDADSAHCFGIPQIRCNQEILFCFRVVCLAIGSIIIAPAQLVGGFRIALRGGLLPEFKRELDQPGVIRRLPRLIVRLRARAAEHDRRQNCQNPPFHISSFSRRCLMSSLSDTGARASRHAVIPSDPLNCPAGPLRIHCPSRRRAEGTVRPFQHPASCRIHSADRYNPATQALRGNPDQAPETSQTTARPSHNPSQPLRHDST